MMEHQLPVTRRRELLSVPRSSAYYQATEGCLRDDLPMRAMDEIRLRLPFYGSRRIADELAEQGHVVNRKCVQRLMRKTGMITIFPGPNTSRAHHAHKVYPKGRCMDNVFIERLWRSLKYEGVYLHAYDTIPQAREGIRKWIDFYSQRRKQQALDRRTPDYIYCTSMKAQSYMEDCA